MKAAAEGTIPNIGQTLSRYRIFEELGEGGMGVVCKTDEVLEVGLQLTDALEAAHATGIVHRDRTRPGPKCRGYPSRVARPKRGWPPKEV